MLSLQSNTHQSWLLQVAGNLNEILVDHAHCEYKAAATAMSIMGTYVDHRDLVVAMTVIVQEEMEHFHLVMKILDERGIPFRKQRPGHYGRELNALLRPHEPDRAVDRLLVSGLIEARSCERFSLLATHVDDRELSSFYSSLFETEASHHSTYVRLAKTFASDEIVKARLNELSAAESQIIGRGNPLPRMHS